MFKGDPAEYRHFSDDGCDVAPHCLSCPLPACRFDMPADKAREMIANWRGEPPSQNFAEKIEIAKQARAGGQYQQRIREAEAAAARDAIVVELGRYRATEFRTR